MRYLVYFLLLFVCLAVGAEEDTNDIAVLAKETLKANEDSQDFAQKKEVTERYADIKEFIQQDFKNGNRKARVDIFLLLDGLVQNNLSSLQSLLATSNNELLSQEFSANINYEYAEKLAYALKENKLLLTTEYRIENNSNKKNCFNYVNGSAIKNNNSFFAPSGLPYYIASYCEDHTFSVKQIQSESAQPQYTIKLNHFNPIQYTETPQEKKPSLHHKSLKSIPTVQKNNVISHELKSSLPNIDNTIQIPEKDKFKFSSHLGYNYFLGYTQDEKISNASFPYGSIVFTKIMSQYERYFLALSYAPIDVDIVHTQNSNTIIHNQNIGTHTKQVNMESGTFLRPEFGMNLYSYEINNNFMLNFYSSLIITIIDSPSRSVNFIGISGSPALNYNLTPKLNLQFTFDTGLNFPTRQPEFFIGPELGIEYKF